MHMPSFVPEILTTKTGPYFIAQFLRDTHLLSALHSYSDTLSVHSMDISLIPLFLYKIPKDCTNVLLTPNIMYTTQKLKKIQIQSNGNGENVEYENKEVPSPIKTDETFINAIGIIGCNSTVLRIGEDSVCAFIQLTQLITLELKNPLFSNKLGIQFVFHVGCVQISRRANN